MRQLLGGWKTVCTVRKVISSSLPEREAMTTRNLRLILFWASVHDLRKGWDCCYSTCSWDGLGAPQRTELEFKETRGVWKKPMVRISVVTPVSEGKVHGASVGWGKPSQMCWQLGDISGWEVSSSAAALQQKVLAGDSPKGAIKITRGGWDITPARKTECKKCPLSPGTHEKEGELFHLVRTRQDRLKLQFRRGWKHLCALLKVQHISQQHALPPHSQLCKLGLAQHPFQ